MDADGLISFEYFATSTADGADLAPVTNEKALEVLESTMDTAKLLKFTAALLGKKEIKDLLFQTWKMYKENTATKTKIISNPLSSIIQNENSESNILSYLIPFREHRKPLVRITSLKHSILLLLHDAYNHKKTSA